MKYIIVWNKEYVVFSASILGDSALGDVPVYSIQLNWELKIEL